jgi:hypothetical protein
MLYKEKGEGQVTGPYVFEALNDLLIIPIHNPSRQFPLNHLTKANIGIATIMSTCATNVKINIFNNSTTKHQKAQKLTNGGDHASFRLDQHCPSSHLDLGRLHYILGLRTN